MEVELFSAEEACAPVICGTDEAGRGPLAGPVVVASVVLPPFFPFDILNDSKKMSERKRLEAEKIIKEEGAVWCVRAIDHSVIDEINILNASLRGMRETSMTVHEMKNFDILLADGNRVPCVPFPVQAVVRGDATVHEIMAASILAKNERDRIMVRYDSIWPEYGFRIHKGYPTKAHYEAIRKYGPCPVHRRSFRLYRDDSNPEERLLL